MKLVFIVGEVTASKNQVRYQRLLALARSFELIVITYRQLPESLRSEPSETYVVTTFGSMVACCLRICRQLAAGQENFIVYTQYVPQLIPLGAACKFLYKSDWVYDLWDHPSLTWSRSSVLNTILKKSLWHLFQKHLLRYADIWVIAMHPDILRFLPHRGKERALIFTRPGVEVHELPKHNLVLSSDDAINVVYAGAVIKARGANLILAWAASYRGRKVVLHLIGPVEKNGVKNLGPTSESGDLSSIEVRSHGALPHPETLKIIEASSIGLCIMDPKILNYRYAYPIKIQEYRSRGLITVATSTPGSQTYITDGESGFLCEYSLEAFSVAMRMAIEVVDNKVALDDRCYTENLSSMRDDWPSINDELIIDLRRALSIT